MLSKEHEWLVSHPEVETKYIGEYIAIVGESVVSHGKDFRDVLKEAKKIGEPWIYKVPSSDKEMVV